MTMQSESNTELRLPESPRLPMEFLSRSWSASSQQISDALAPSKSLSAELLRADSEDSKTNSSASSFASSKASHLVLQRIMSYTEMSPMTSARQSHSGPLLLSPNSSCGDLDNDVVKVFWESSNGGSHQPEIPGGHAAVVSSPGRGKTVGRWLKDRREKKKEETRAQNAQLHAVVSVAGVAAAVAAMAAAKNGKDDKMRKLDLAVASAATLVAAHCVEVAEAMGVEKDQLASVVGSAVNVRCSDDVLTLAAAAATALRGAATLKARVMKDIQNAAAIHKDKETDKQDDRSNLSTAEHTGELALGGSPISTSELEYLGTTGRELLKRTRNGDLHWKIVSVYIHRSGEVMLKMTSKYVGGTITNKKKNVVIEICKNMHPWPGRHLLEDGEHRRYFGLKTAVRGVVEFECRDQREHDLWTEGVSKLLAIVDARKKQSQALKASLPNHSAFGTE